MKDGQCFCCDHCDTSRINDRQQARCTKFSTYVDLFNGCDWYSNKKHDELFAQIAEAMNNAKQ